MPKNSGFLPKEELFCQYYAKSGQAFGNQTRAYGLAYGKDFTDKRQATICSSLGNRLLGKVKILERCEVLMNERMSADDLDNELEWVARQRDNLHAKVSAISEANKVRGRITTKIKHKFEGVGDEALKERLANIVTGSDGDSGGTGSEEEGK